MFWSCFSCQDARGVYTILTLEQMFQEKNRGKDFGKIMGGVDIHGILHLACKALFSGFTISCNQKCSVAPKMHQIRFSLGLWCGLRWVSSGCSSRPASGNGNGEVYLLPIPHPLDTYFALPWVGGTCSKDLDRCPCRMLIIMRDARLSHRLSVCSVLPSVRLSYSWSVSKQCKLRSRNLHCGLAQGV